jgi:outer membrane protein assembly factor BamB
MAHRRDPEHGSDRRGPVTTRPISRRAAVQGLMAGLLGTRHVLGQSRALKEPRPLAADAVTHDWTAFLGPAHNAVSTETKLSRRLPPPIIWEFTRGSGYASPAIAGARLVFLHRLGGEELVECMHAETGASRWRFRYRTDYEDRYGYNDGPRSSPVIDASRVFSVGAQGQLHCLDLENGKVIWKRDLRKEYRVPQDFFGTASTPLVEGPLLIVNVGAPGGPCVVGFDKASGREVWRAGREWGPSYASPVPAIVHGKRRVFVFAGGESSPPSGGLMSIDPADGRVDFAFPWRSRAHESVNASCPVVFDNKVFVSASYRAGGALIGIGADFSPKLLWSAPDFALHFNTAIQKDGHLYGFDGRNEPDASLACVDAASGRVVWRETPEGIYRGSLLAVDGQFLCLGEHGHLLWLDLTPKGYREVSRAWLFKAPETWGLPALSRGLLYVTQNARDVETGARPRLLCYDLRA